MPHSGKKVEWFSFNLKAHLKGIERDTYDTYLRATEGNKTLAARLLHMSRPTLIYRLRMLGMSQWIEDKGALKS
jgi:DNA-binding NtrC family response regulator